MLHGRHIRFAVFACLIGGQIGLSSEVNAKNCVPAKNFSECKPSLGEYSWFEVNDGAGECCYGEAPKAIIKVQNNTLIFDGLKSETFESLLKNLPKGATVSSTVKDGGLSGNIKNISEEDAKNIESKIGASDPFTTNK